MSLKHNVRPSPDKARERSARRARRQASLDKQHRRQQLKDGKK